MDRTEMPAPGTHQAQPSARRFPELDGSEPTHFIGAPVLLITEPVLAPSVTDLPAFTAGHAPTPPGPAFDLMRAIGEWADVDDTQLPGAAIVTVIDPATDTPAVFEFAGTTVTDIVNALNAARTASVTGGN